MTVRFPLDQGAVTEVRDRDGDTALLPAVRNGHRETARVLLEAKANAHTLNRDGSRPLAEVCARGWTYIANMLSWQKLNPVLVHIATRDHLNYRLLCRAAQNGSVESISQRRV